MLGMALELKAALALVGLEVRERVCIAVREGVVEAVGSWASCGPRPLGGEWLAVLPQPANMHVHSADRAFPEYGVDLRLEEAVEPPRGLKHRLLERLARAELVEAIAGAYGEAWRAGTGLLVDFREGGGVGCEAAAEAAARYPGMEVVYLGRPGPGWPGPCRGLGLSSPLDYPLEEVKALVEASGFSMTHVAETRRARDLGDLEAALEAGFDAVVHGVFLSQRDLAMLASRGVGLVACVSSNAWHGLGLPPLAAAAEEGVRVALGTDNAAWSRPDPWAEASRALLLLRLQGMRGRGEARLVLRWLFLEGYLMMGLRPRLVEEGAPAYMALANVGGLGVVEAVNKEYALVKRLTGDRVVARVDRGRLTVFTQPYLGPRR